MQPHVSNNSSFQCILVGNMQMQVLGLYECKNAFESHGCKFLLLHSSIDHNNNIEPTIVVTLGCTPTCNGWWGSPCLCSWACGRRQCW